MRPSSERIPVAVTSIVAGPAATLVPEYSIEVASGTSGATVASFFSVRTDSPVRADSSTHSACASTRRPSAGTREPASRSTRSPATSSCEAIPAAPPSRTTPTVGIVMACSEAIDLSARYSWRNPIHAFSTTTPTMTSDSVTSPSAADSTAAAMSSRIIADLSCPSRMLARLTPWPRSSSFSPSTSRRAAASSALSPRAA